MDDYIEELLEITRQYECEDELLEVDSETSDWHADIDECASFQDAAFLYLSIKAIPLGSGDGFLTDGSVLTLSRIIFSSDSEMPLLSHSFVGFQYLLSHALD